jgi:hypothetical protein
MAKFQPIAGNKNPYTVISVAINCVIITAKNRGIEGFIDQKCPLVLAINTIK